jgi:crossover junction endodeoxyribonuclease RuvC
LSIYPFLSLFYTVFMRILGIDPGYDRLGIAVIEKENSGKESVVFSGCIRTSAKDDFVDRLHDLGNQFRAILKKYKPDEAAIEDLYFAKNSTTAMKVAEARGVIQYVTRENGIPVFAYHPNAIKIAVTGYGAAKKTDIAFMIPKLVAVPAGKKLDDELDAIAVALTHSAQRKTVRK